MARVCERRCCRRQQGKRERQIAMDAGVDIARPAYCSVRKSHTAAADLDKKVQPWSPVFNCSLRLRLPVVVPEQFRVIG